MTVNELMTLDPVCCTPQTPLREVARLMSSHDCGEIPVVETKEGRLLVGVVTDRDIVLRAVAEGRNPADTPIASCMTTNVVTVRPETSLDDCRRLMEEHQIRRVPVVDGSGACCGIVSQADVAQRASTGDTGELVREVSRPAVPAH
jgi:CBS domain-containing protein